MKLEMEMTPEQMAEWLTNLARRCQDWEAYQDVLTSVIKSAFAAGRERASQTQRVPLPEPDETGCWYGVDHCTLPHCDCSERSAAAQP